MQEEEGRTYAYLSLLMSPGRLSDHLSNICSFVRPPEGGREYAMTTEKVSPACLSAKLDMVSESIFQPGKKSIW